MDAEMVDGQQAPASQKPVNAPESAPVNFRLQRVLTGHKKSVASVKFSPNGQWLATASADKTAKIWNVADGTLFQDLVGHTKGISDCAWTKDSEFIATASDDKTLRLWEVKTGECLKEFIGHKKYVFCCNFSPHCNKLVSGSYDETIRVWEVKTGKCIATLPAHSDPVTAVDFSRDGTLVVSSSYDGLCRIWDADNGTCGRTLIDEENPPASFVRFTPNGKYLLMGTLNNTLRLWDYVQNKPVKVYSGGHVNKEFCIFAAFCLTHPSAKLVVVGSEDKRVFLYDLNGRKGAPPLQIIDGRESAEAEGGGHCSAVVAVDCHPSLCLIATGALATGEQDGDCTVRLWADDRAGGR